MAAGRVERRLAAILAADIVGYSRPVEQDEAGTLAAIRSLRLEVVDPLLAERHGRIVKLMGDGAIVEFGSVVDAVLKCRRGDPQRVVTPALRPNASNCTAINGGAAERPWSCAITDPRPVRPATL